MSYTKVRGYKTSELLDLATKAQGFKGFPQGYWIIGVRSNEDTYNVFDDKFYLFKGKEFIMVLTGTTNSGGYGLKNYTKWDKRGTAVIASGIWNYNVYQKSDGKTIRHHNGKLQCLRQIANIFYYRDSNKNNKVEQTGKMYYENNATNFHLNSYKILKGIVSWIIGGWSTGCLVANNATEYYDMLAIIPFTEKVSMLIIDEKN